MYKRAAVAMTLAALAFWGESQPAPADSVPEVLPKPDNLPGSPVKPVKVYILAGQSNMVGFGTLSGAKPPYPSIFYSADPAVIPGRLQVDRMVHGLAKHGIYVSADTTSEAGAVARVFKGPYYPEINYESMTSVQEVRFPLGTVEETLPAISGPHTVVARAFIDVPSTGTYTVHPGFGDSTQAIAVLDGREVYRKDGDAAPRIEKVRMEAGKRYPISITYLKPGSAALWLEQVDLKGRGDLKTLTLEEGKFPWMVDAQGQWTVRQDVTYAEARIAPEGRWEPLTATSNGKFIGPEVPFGYVMGTFHDEQVLLIETSMGNRGLWWDFRPPSSGKTSADGADKWEGLEYRLMVKGVRTMLDKISEVVPDYQGQGYEMAGFAWWQGHKDYTVGQSKAEYEKHLVNLIRDLRKEFKVPNMPAVVATIGFGGYDMAERETEIWKAQMAVADPRQHPGFADQVATVDTRGYWRTGADSPTRTGYHYNHNAETYMLTGDAMGRAMVELQGGEVEWPPTPEPPAAPVVADNPQPTDEALAASEAATVPMIIDGMLTSYVNNPGHRKALAEAINGTRPRRMNQLLRDQIDRVAAYYQAVGISKYDWKSFGPEMKNASWHYLSFDPPETRDKSKGSRYRPVTYPAGSENWFAVDFDPANAGWKTGYAPFGQKEGALVALGHCMEGICGCGIPPRTLWEHEVLLLRQTFKVPALKEGHRYRLVVGGSAHVNAGEGYALYIDGNLVAESNRGIGKREGGAARGGHMYADVLPAFSDGEIVVGVKSFLRYNHPRIKVYPPSGHISVWLEEQKIPPVAPE